MSEHTPGPWTVVQGATTCPTEWTVVSAERFIGDIEYEADARLIASAPALLAALERMVLANVDGQPNFYTDADGLIGQARAAIDKATGTETTE